MEGRTKLWNFFLENKWGIQGDVWGAPDMRGGAGWHVSVASWQASSGGHQARSSEGPILCRQARAGISLIQAVPVCRLLPSKPGFTKKAKEASPSPTTAQLQSQQIWSWITLHKLKYIPNHKEKCKMRRTECETEPAALCMPCLFEKRKGWNKCKKKGRDLV